MAKQSLERYGYRVSSHTESLAALEGNGVLGVALSNKKIKVLAIIG